MTRGRFCPHFAPHTPLNNPIHTPSLRYLRRVCVCAAPLTMFKSLPRRIKSRLILSVITHKLLLCTHNTMEKKLDDLIKTGTELKTSNGKIILSINSHIEKFNR